MSKTNGPSYQS